MNYLMQREREGVNLGVVSNYQGKDLGCLVYELIIKCNTIQSSTDKQYQLRTGVAPGHKG